MSTRSAESRIATARRTRASSLDLAGLGLDELPESLGELTRLTELSLSNNRLSELPDWLGQLTNLTFLFLDRNQLSVLPDSLGDLTKLTILMLDHNQLTALPDTLGRLTNLTRLSLTGNQLTALPDTLGHLTNLSHLYLERNQLTALPDTLGGLANLTHLYLHGNDALAIPVEVLGPEFPEEPGDPAAILGYYHELRTGGSRPLNEAKLVVVGRGGVGKTSLVKRLLHDTFDPNERKTDGIRIDDWPLALGTDEVHLHVWDFGGQEIMHATHQFFLTQRSLYLLVLNGREGREDADAEYWLSLIESFGGESPVILALNKIKEHPFDLNRRALREKYPSIREFAETDCEDRSGIDELRTVIERETDALDHLRDPFPTSWFAIKDRLAAMEEDYVGFGEFRRICADAGEADPAAQDSLAGYLHSLGIALNYRDDIRLSDTNVLNPRWVTNGIYAILNADRLSQQRGVLAVADLVAILDAARYPPESYGFLLGLMNKFELCFRFPEEDRYLVPELLDKQQPEAADQFDRSECLNFEYHYPVLPEGLLPRFIVRTNVMSADDHRWRTGVLLHLDDNRARVVADIEARRVSVRLDGPVEGRRRLLAVIRADFDHIHRSFTFRPQEMVVVPDHPSALIPYDDLVVMERENESGFKQVIDGKLVQLDVQQLLNGVDLAGARERRSISPDARGVRVFYSYAHEDEEYRNQLETHLKILHRAGLIEPWSDRRIAAGDEWQGEIDDNLERADVILLLISADFIASDYCYDVEMTRALERHDAGQARVVPIIVRHVNWQRAPFGRLQALPEGAEPVTSDHWSSRDKAWANVSEHIEAVVTSLRDQRARA